MDKEGKEGEGTPTRVPNGSEACAEKPEWTSFKDITIHIKTNIRRTEMSHLRTCEESGLIEKLSVRGQNSVVTTYTRE